MIGFPLCFVRELFRRPSRGVNTTLPSATDVPLTPHSRPVNRPGGGVHPDVRRDLPPARLRHPPAPAGRSAASAETRWQAAATTANFPKAVRENEEVLPVNAVSTWVLPSGVTVGR
ncbi:hypothetical protein CP981_29130 [Streptomyces platensis]|uniref:Uncharacterized protein n=1 Tax=Streptomyces platensis TaxID=58346 RepID=A0AAE6NLV1_STRPT|nr:hypothetical protein CP981_29130 [Streptomyces platensis]